MRIRTIKPEFFAHERLFDAEQESKLPLRVAFAGLWCAADRKGRFRWRPRYLQTVILPYDKVDMARVLDALATRGFVVKYSVGDDEFGVIPSFTRHQVVNNRESPSELPEPPCNQQVDACPTRDDACPTPLSSAQAEGKGREQEGKEEENYVLSSKPDGLAGHNGNNGSAVCKAAMVRVWSRYLDLTGRDGSLLKLTPLRQSKFRARWDETIRKLGGDAAQAERALIYAAERLAESDWHMGRDPKTTGKRYCDWEGHLFRSAEQTERWLEREPKK